MKITVTGCGDEFYRAAAWRIAAAIAMNPRAVIGLSTGRTTGNIHRSLCSIHRAAGFDVSKVTFFGLDEVTGVDRDYAGACYTMLRNELIDELGIPESNFLMLPVESDDFGASCREFTDEIARRGGIDLLMLGLGENGHLGFNQPGSPLNGQCRLAEMDPVLEARIRRETGSAPDHRLGGVTLGVRDIMHARRIVLVANGSNKTDIARQMLTADISSDIPATVLQLHPDCEFLFDRDAAAWMEKEN